MCPSCSLFYLKKYLFSFNNYILVSLFYNVVSFADIPTNDVSIIDYNKLITSEIDHNSPTNHVVSEVENQTSETNVSAANQIIASIIAHSLKLKQLEAENDVVESSNEAGPSIDAMKTESEGTQATIANKLLATLISSGLCQMTANTESNGGSSMGMAPAGDFWSSLSEPTTDPTSDSNDDLDKSTLAKKLHTCSECDFTTTKQCKLTVHIEKVHRKIKRFQCSECDYQAYDNGGLTNHFKRVHQKLKRFKCEHCDYSAYNASVVKVHADSVHKKLKIYRCELCDYSAARISHLKRHIMSVHRQVSSRKIHVLYLCFLWIIEYGRMVLV